VLNGLESIEAVISNEEGERKACRPNAPSAALHRGADGSQRERAREQLDRGGAATSERCKQDGACTRASAAAAVPSFLTD
jgi:hypothetical protein